MMPSFVTRVERPDRGGAVDRLPRQRARAGERWARGSGSTRLGDGPGRPSVTSCASRRRGRPADGAAVRGRRQREEAIRGAVAGARRGRRAPSCSPISSGERANRRHRPGRGFEALRYRFEIVSDYGAFRDLQRHRMLTVQWQSLDPESRRRRARAGRAGRLRRRVPARARALAPRVRAPRRRRARHRGALRALPRLPDPLHPRPQRARGDAADRAALGARGPSELPGGRARDARADQRRCTPPSAAR